MKIQSIFVLLGIIILTVITIIGGVKSCSKETSPAKTTKNFIVPQKLKPTKWERIIILNPGESHGPKEMRNGSSWRIRRGKEVVVQIDNQSPFLDSPGRKHAVSGKVITFSNHTKNKIVIFFKY